MSQTIDKIRPITIIKTQWKGCDPKHYWVAFDAHTSEVPTDIGLNLDFERNFFSTDASKPYIYAFGKSAGAALKALQNLKLGKK